MSLYQQGAFFVKGLSSFTKGGYQSASKSFKAQDLDVNVADRVFMITGANSGIGKSAAISIAKKGGIVHLVCRNEERALKAKEEIVTESKNDKVFVHLLDTSKLKDVHRFTKDFSSSNDRLNVLINNAGCMVNERTLTEDNLEVNFATNTMGTYILTMGLLPLLQKSDKPRVITVSSGGMYTQKLNVKDLQFENENFDGTFAYARNKRQQIIMTEEWAKKYQDVHFSAMHPGWADTPAVRTSMPGFYEKMKDRLRSAEQGADTIVWLSVSDSALLRKSGLFFLDRKPASTHLPLAWTGESAADRATLMKVLYEISEKAKAEIPS